MRKARTDHNEYSIFEKNIVTLGFIVVPKLLQIVSVKFPKSLKKDFS